MLQNGWEWEMKSVDGGRMEIWREVGLRGCFAGLGWPGTEVSHRESSSRQD
jgi:hypothetical protein